MKKRATKIPYEGYTLPPSAEKGGQFVDFNRVIQRKPIKKVRIIYLIWQKLKSEMKSKKLLQRMAEERGMTKE